MDSGAIVNRRFKFNAVMLVMFALGLAATGYFADIILRENAREEVIDKARVMRASALAMRGYTANEIRPLLQQLRTDEFLPHTVPSFAAQTNFREVQKTFRNYSYKEAALNPTNPRDLATDWEADIINAFRNDPTLTEAIVTRDSAVGQMLTLSHAIRITNPACLQCHSSPASAPDAMLASYGTANGFGWQMNEIVGAQIVTVPMSIPLERARQTLFLIMGILAGAFLVIGITLNFAVSFKDDYEPERPLPGRSVA